MLLHAKVPAFCSNLIMGSFSWRRLMNHSCEPTLQPLEVRQLRGYFRILFAAKRHIYPGDELTIDYGARALLSSGSYVSSVWFVVLRSTGDCYCAFMPGVGSVCR